MRNTAASVHGAVSLSCWNWPAVRHPLFTRDVYSLVRAHAAYGSAIGDMRDCAGSAMVTVIAQAQHGWDSTRMGLAAWRRAGQGGGGGRWLAIEDSGGWDVVMGVCISVAACASEAGEEAGGAVGSD